MAYHTAEICEKGHIISKNGIKIQNFCKECGSKVIHRCPSCNSSIDGVVQDAWDFSYKFDLPYYCDKCGKAYPWTLIAIETIQELLLLDPTFNQDDVNFISNNVSELITETPKTKLVATKMKLLIGKATVATGNLAKEILIDVLSETAKKIILEG